MLTNIYPFSLPEIPYPYDSLEPYIDTETMHYHYDKHFKTYIDNLNKALEPYPALKKKTLYELVRHQDNLPIDVSRSAGGTYNHFMFFNKIGPKNENSIPSERLSQIIDKTFGSFENFKKKFSDNAKSVFGSGWTYLVVTREGRLKIVNTRNQQTPVQSGYTPIILFDVWEHAYYLKYKNLRADYVENIWNVVQFDASSPCHSSFDMSVRSE